MRRALAAVRRVRETAGPLWWFAGLLFLSARFGDMLNLYTSMFLLPALLSEAELGAVEPVLRLVGFAGIPLAVISVVGAKYLSAYHATAQYGKVKRFLRDMLALGLASSSVFVLVLVAVFPALQRRLGVDSPHLLPGLAGMAVVSSCVPLMGFVLQGMQRFYTTAMMGGVDPLLRLGGVLLLVPMFRLSGYLFALIAAGVGSISVGLLGLRRFIGPAVKSEPYYEDRRGMLAYAWPVAISVAATTLQGFIEPFVVRHFLSVQDAAGYYIAMRFGSIPMFLVGAVAFVVFPMFSHRHERGEDTTAMLGQTLLVTALITLAGVVALALGAGWILGLRADWARYLAYAPLVWRIGLVVSVQSAATLYVTHEVACRRFRFLWVVVPVALLESAMLYTLFGWSAMARFLPAALWQAVDAAAPRTLAFAVWLMLAARVIVVLGLLGQWRKRG